MAPDYETNDKAGVPLVMKLKKTCAVSGRARRTGSAYACGGRRHRLPPAQVGSVHHVHLRGREWLCHRDALSGLYSAPHNKPLLNKLKTKLMDRLEMSNAGDVSRVVGMNVTCDREKGAITISQDNYRENVIQRYYGRLQPRLHPRSRAKTVPEPTRE